MQAPGQRGGWVLLGILGGGVPPGSPNPDPISNPQKVIFFTRFQTRLLNSMIGWYSVKKYQKVSNVFKSAIEVRVSPDMTVFPFNIHL